MKNLQIGDNDFLGMRFNGHDLHNFLREKGVESSHLVWNKKSNDPFTFEIGKNFTNRDALNYSIFSLEEQSSLQSTLYPFSYEILFHKIFLDTDIVHYHLIHNRFFNISLFPFLTRLKPSVWTLHDPWAMTGHCIHPFDCERWKTGCGNCPYLKTEFSLKDDNTSLNWEMKKFNYEHSQFDLIVASAWMENMVKQSPLFAHCRVHKIPFGINLDLFKPMDSQEAKKRLGIPQENFVIAFRSSAWALKGLSYVKDCLYRLKKSVSTPITLLLFGETGLLSEFSSSYQILDLGWIRDESFLIQAYNAADVFLMPSTAESFGMMALEAMACGKPVIAFRGTALEEVISSDSLQGGVLVASKDADAFQSAVEQIIKNPLERERIGRDARILVQKKYDKNDYVNRMIQLYADVIARHHFDEKDHFLLDQLKKRAIVVDNQPDSLVKIPTIPEKDLPSLEELQFISKTGFSKLYEFKFTRFLCKKILLPPLHFLVAVYLKIIAKKK